jgi:3-oxoacyl-[acyl-carrier-protein] synthase-3
VSRRCIVRAVGAHLPERIMTNQDFTRILDTSDEWIAERTGIRQRHIAAEGELTSGLGAAAARDALANAGLAASDIDLIVVGTTTPDDTMPATAVHIQRLLGITHGAAFDVSAACSGFVYALTVADSLLKSGQGTRALVIGAETYSRIVDWQDRGTCILFGDGAGAMVLEAVEEGAANGRGVLHCALAADGNYADILHTTGGVSRTKTAGVLTMQGKEVFRHAVAKMSESVAGALKATGYAVADIDWLVPHQANWRILASVAQKLGISEDDVVSTVAQHANTSAASIPLALDAATRDGRLKPGHLVALTALGSGLTWGSAIIRW